MANNRLVWCGENPRDHPREDVGGKGYNLLKLFNLAQDTKLFNVPEFFIIPTHYSRDSVYGKEKYLKFKTDEVKRTFEQMKKPVIARSSSTLEDGINASFAGMFSSIPYQTSYEQLVQTLLEIDDSADINFNSSLKRYAEKMGITTDSRMALIVQEQVINFLEKGVIQLEEHTATLEGTTRRGTPYSHEIEYRFLREMIKEEDVWIPRVENERRDYIGEGEMWYAVHCAKRAKDLLGLEGSVQVEFLLAPTRLPDFVQIRQLPKIKSYAASLDLDIPQNVPYLESQVCNGVAGDISFPAYVTFSQSAFAKILIETGMKAADERMQALSGSKLLQSEEFHNAQNFDSIKYMMGVRDCVSYFEKMWKKGNSLFSDYVLVCDKLDESICGMNNLTTNKRGIITCLEAQKTSHAMTVARDLGIPAMGVNGDISDPNYFFHQIETGDIVRMKSDGKRAVAYIQRRNE